MIKQYQTLLSGKKKLSNDIWLFRFKLVNPAEINFQAGQYLILKVNNQPRLYSIFSPNYIKDYIEFMIKIIPEGIASNYFNNLQPGEQVSFEGPAGVFTLKENEKNKVFLVTSTGLAPVYSMILSYLRKNSAATTPNLYLFWGLKNYEDACFINELKQLAINNQQFKLFICLSREQNFDKIPEAEKTLFHLGRITSVWEKFVTQSNNNFDYYICGSREVVESLNEYLLTKNIIKGNIFFEKF